MPHQLPQHLKVRPPVSLDAASSTKRQRSKLENWGTVLVPLHYEPGYSYPLVIWGDFVDGPKTPIEASTAAREPLSLASAMSDISLRNFAGISARTPLRPQGLSLLGTGPIAEPVAELTKLASLKVNVHPERVFAVIRSDRWEQVVAFIQDARKLAGVVWIAENIELDSSRLPAALGVREPGKLLMSIPDSPAALQMAGSRISLLHSLGWEPQAIASKPGPTFLKTSLANANRWMMGLVTGQNPFPTSDAPASTEPSITEFN